MSCASAWRQRRARSVPGDAVQSMATDWSKPAGLAASLRRLNEWLAQKCCAAGRLCARDGLKAGRSRVCRLVDGAGHAMNGQQPLIDRMADALAAEVEVAVEMRRYRAVIVMLIVMTMVASGCSDSG